MSRVRLAEMYVSIQGESTRAGRPCAFIRLAGCNLRCVYCDAESAARGEGAETPIGDIMARARACNVRFVEITGGEPLLQPGAGELIRLLADEGFEVLVETNGTVDIGDFDRRAGYIVDIKTPGSGAAGSFLDMNFDRLCERDEVKFVVTSRADFGWAASVIKERGLEGRLPVLISPAWGMVDPKDLAAWIIESGLGARLNLQLHKYIWGPDAEGV